MPDDAKAPPCAAFWSRVPHLPASNADTDNHPHIKSCTACREFLQEIKSIAKHAQQPLRFGTDNLGPDDWSEIT